MINLKKLNKKVASNKAKTLVAKKNLARWSNSKVGTNIRKRYNFSLDRIYFTGDNGLQNFLVFASIRSSLILDSNKKDTNWILTKISSEKIKPFGTNLEPAVSNLNNGRVILKFNNSVYVRKTCSSFYSKFIYK